MINLLRIDAAVLSGFEAVAQALQNRGVSFYQIIYISGTVLVVSHGAWAYITGVRWLSALVVMLAAFYAAFWINRARRLNDQNYTKLPTEFVSLHFPLWSITRLLILSMEIGSNVLKLALGETWFRWTVDMVPDAAFICFLYFLATTPRPPVRRRQRSTRKAVQGA